MNGANPWGIEQRFPALSCRDEKGGSLDERLTPEDQTGQRDPRNMSCREKENKKKPYTQSKSNMYRRQADSKGNRRTDSHLAASLVRCAQPLHCGRLSIAVTVAIGAQSRRGKW